MAKPPKQSMVTKKTLIRLEKERAQMKYLLIGSIIIGALVVGVIIFGLLSEYVIAPNRAVAKVGNESITVKDFQWRVRYYRYNLVQQYYQYSQTLQYYNDESLTSYFESYLAQYENQLSTDMVESVGSDVLDTMVEEKIISQEADKLGITVSDEEIDEELEVAFGYYASGTPTAEPVTTSIPTSTYSPTQLALVTAIPSKTPTSAVTSTPDETEVAAQPTATATTSGFSAQDVGTPTATATPEQTATPEPTATEYTHDGYETLKSDYITKMADLNLTEADLKKMVRNDLLRDKVREEITKDVKPEADMVWARQILVADLETAQTVVDLVKAGDDFTAIADKLNASTETSATTEEEVATAEVATYTDVGWFGVGEMDAEYEKVAFNLEIGQTSDPIQTADGYYVIQVLGHEVRQLTDEEFETAKDDAFTTWLDGIKSTDTVQKFEAVWKENVPSEPNLDSSYTVVE